MSYAHETTRGTSSLAAGRGRHRRVAGAAMLGAVALLAPSIAHAHFILMSPDSWKSQDTQGNPQKTGPCGNEAGGTVSNKVTAYHPGDKVTITINEVVPHPGHYRVALGTNGPGDLPAEPPVTAGTMACGTVPVQSPPVFPVIADGLFDHTAAFTAPQTIQVTLPTNVTCTKCSLQVLEFMSQHGAPCFYHHCADISIMPGNGGDGGVSDGGGTDSRDSGPSGTGGASGGGMGGSIVVSGTGGAGTGGATTGTGGASTTGVGGSGTGGAPVTGGMGGKTTQPPKDDGGCTIAGGAASRGAGALGLVAALGLAWWARRRRRPS